MNKEENFYDLRVYIFFSKQEWFDTYAIICLQYDFPKQEAVIQFVVEAIQAEAFNPKTLFLIGSYTIGNMFTFFFCFDIIMLRSKLFHLFSFERKGEAVLGSCTCSTGKDIHQSFKTKTPRVLRILKRRYAVVYSEGRGEPHSRCALVDACQFQAAEAYS